MFSIQNVLVKLEGYLIFLQIIARAQFNTRFLQNKGGSNTVGRQSPSRWVFFFAIELQQRETFISLLISVFEQRRRRPS